ncbi:MAG: thiamine-phosphate kinase [Thermodesulfobacteriota bacterium]
MSDPGGERRIISRIRQQTSQLPADLVTGIGDDCAIYRLDSGRVGLVTTDAMVEGVHFDPVWHPPRLLGRKAASVNLSDIAAMGGHPRFALLTLAIPRPLTAEWLDAFMDGFLEALCGHDAVLIGGDTVSSGQGLVLSVTLMGEAATDRVLTRHGAQVGDVVLVGGNLGEAAAGLALCRQGLDKKAEWAPLVAAHLDPSPQVALGLALAESGLVHAMMDLSDGLATDLAHICAESGVGAEVDGGAVPLSPLLCKAAEACGQSALEWALSGGEDYRLLLTVAARDAETVMALASTRAGVTLSAVGRIVAGTGVTLLADGDRREISYRGYEHCR